MVGWADATQMYFHFSASSCIETIVVFLCYLHSYELLTCFTVFTDVGKYVTKFIKALYLCSSNPVKQYVIVIKLWIKTQVASD